MKKYVSLDKRSKKAQREYYSERRHTWGELNPVTRSVPSGKTYNRKKDKKRIGRELSNEFQADPFCYFVERFGKDSLENTSVSRYNNCQGRGYVSC